jgi:hypothetical protein
LGRIGGCPECHGLTADFGQSRVRLCIDLRSPDWIEQVRVALENRLPARTFPDAADFKMRAHNAYLGDPNLRAVEFTPRIGEMRNWCIAYPSDGPKAVQFGIGTANGGQVGIVLHDSFDGTEELDGVAMTLIGAGDALTPATSAYIVFAGAFPRVLAFGHTTAPYKVPELNEWRMIRVS